ncbi:pentapeptide repeat-containing protein [Amycolatopsis australiensis]|uniref:Pentapeptide repeat-containing protein n=1 Tax=Amycolatopsis australiensis TaxID=546364 RepID=A0A1K1SR26_9PSEU|nr:pentapeptide repeat-containing protein [Amycolatopsis australiensis]SFW86668.1 Pentapeptide repeat-containing protein [Amycolatopsis australiensis]
MSVNWPAMTSVITALTAVGALIFTALSLNATRAQVALSEQGQVTGRFTTAVEELDKGGGEHLQARLGALYSLERLAHDSPRDQPTIIEVISAFVRTIAPLPSTRQGSCPWPGADVQAALTILGRRDVSQDHGAYINLARTCLSGTSLRGADLAYGSLAGAKIEEVDLTDANLTGTSLRDASLRRAILTNANLSHLNGDNANFYWAALDQTDFTGSSLYGADFTISFGTRTNFNDASLTNAKHDHASFYDTISNRGTQDKWW